MLQWFFFACFCFGGLLGACIFIVGRREYLKARAKLDQMIMHAFPDVYCPKCGRRPVRRYGRKYACEVGHEFDITGEEDMR